MTRFRRDRCKNKDGHTLQIYNIYSCPRCYSILCPGSL